MPRTVVAVVYQSLPFSMLIPFASTERRPLAAASLGELLPCPPEALEMLLTCSYGHTCIGAVMVGQYLLNIDV
jgi:hypothetical protein